MRVYLAGPINGCSDEEAKTWREFVKEQIDAEWDDPMDRDYRGREDEAVALIVEGDKRDVQKCDVLLANCPKASVGTSMEVFYAWQLGKVTVVIAPEPISPWLRYHATKVCSDLDEAVAYLRTTGPERNGGTDA